MPKTYTFRELIRALRDFDPQFYVDASRGKGSHRFICHPDGTTLPVKYHGESTEIRAGMLAAIVRKFRLPRGVVSPKGPDRERRLDMLGRGGGRPRQADRRVGDLTCPWSRGFIHEPG